MKEQLHPIAKKAGYSSNAAFYKDFPTEESYKMKHGGMFLSADGSYKKAQGTGTWDGQSGTYFQFGGAMEQDSDAPIQRSTSQNKKKGIIDRSTYMPHPKVPHFDAGGSIEKQTFEKNLINSFINTNQKYTPRPDRSAEEGLRNAEHYTSARPTTTEYKEGGNYEDFLYNKFQIGGNAMNSANYQGLTQLTPSGEIKRTSVGVFPQPGVQTHQGKIIGQGSQNNSNFAFNTQSPNMQGPARAYSPTSMPNYQGMAATQGHAPLAGGNAYDISQLDCPDFNNGGVIGPYEYGYDYYQDGGEFNEEDLEELKYGGIHIKKSHEGRFTAYKKRTGKTTEEALHSKDPHVRQMAQFSLNASKWKKEFGGSTGYTVGSQHELEDHEIQNLINQGYKIKYV